jgi:Na+/citrate or Na+/malate symporter
MLRVSVRTVLISAVGVAVLIAVGMAFGLSFERAAYLAPVLVLIAGGIAFLVVLWTKVIYEAARKRSDRTATSASRSDSSV